ncbi:MAG: exodeoxyribonuclease VII small subunit [Clostridia bacterium]|nr:exodeoxyribonuclease VII small subunit [Clostridia bacterium]
MAAVKKCKSFEQELGSLSSMTEKLSSGELSLEESMRMYEDGMKLAEKLAKDLSSLEARLEQIDIKTCEISPMDGNEEGN